MNIPVKVIETPIYVMNEDGEFRCPHENVEVEYDRGGDGITEPGPSWGVYCFDCHNEEMEDYEIDNILESHWANQEPDDRDDY